MSRADILPDGWSWSGPDAIRRPDGEEAIIEWGEASSVVRIGQNLTAIVARGNRKAAAHRRMVVDSAIRLLLP